MKRYLGALLICVNAALAVALAWLWLAPATKLRTHWMAPAPRITDYEVMVPPLGKPQAMGQHEFLAMLDRPLFSITRRPPPPPPEVAAAPPPPDRLSTSTLTGIYSGDGIGGVIITYDGKDKSVPLKGQLDGWTLKSLAGNRAYFGRGSQTRSLTLQIGKLGYVEPGKEGRPSAKAPGATPAPIQRPRSPTGRRFR